MRCKKRVVGPAAKVSSRGQGGGTVFSWPPGIKERRSTGASTNYYCTLPPGRRQGRPSVTTLFYVSARIVVRRFVRVCHAVRRFFSHPVSLFFFPPPPPLLFLFTLCNGPLNRSTTTTATTTTTTPVPASSRSFSTAARVPSRTNSSSSCHP